jgi:hypothetical protein
MRRSTPEIGCPGWNTIFRASSRSIHNELRNEPRNEYCAFNSLVFFNYCSTCAPQLHSSAPGVELLSIGVSGLPPNATALNIPVITFVEALCGRM